ncbi:hypothetical protein H5397_09930 [Propioniciclava sp. MC1683]|uniref:hypothetical protein n=1 Tax=Propioniciclava sp. MC1683 TaxID=2760309 RepID=UPI0015FF749F|nr:hypothetical protein [Propioniciclava sp. MC1683]MBB1501742.1 hypothetical protein [Propioniciclava sp. MC1683]
MFNYLREWLGHHPDVHPSVAATGLSFLLPGYIDTWEPGKSLRYSGVAKQEARLCQLAVKIAPEFLAENQEFQIRDQGDALFAAKMFAAMPGRYRVRVINPERNSEPTPRWLLGDVSEALVHLLSSVDSGNPWLTEKWLDRLLSRINAETLNDEVLFGRLMVLLRVLGRDLEAAQIARSVDPQLPRMRAAALADLVVINQRLGPLLREPRAHIEGYATELYEIAMALGHDADPLELESWVNALGLFFAATGRFDECRSLYSWFESQVGDSLPPHARAIFESNFGRVLTWAAEPDLVREGETRLRLAANLEPQFADHWVRVADFLVDAGRMDDASQLIARGLDECADTAALIAVSARLKFLAGEFHEAMTLYLNSYRMQPERHERLLHAAQAAGNAGLVDEMADLLSGVEVAYLTDPLVETFELLSLEVKSREMDERLRRAWMCDQLAMLSALRPEWEVVRENVELLTQEG